MTFSIMIPVYNVEVYVGECIESILRQSYPNFEIILVDDGSTDGSGTICDRYQERFPEKVRVIHNENQGLLRARLCGIRAALGDVCLSVDSDDYIRYDALDCLHKRFLETGCDMIFFNASTSADFRRRFQNYRFGDGQCFEGGSKAALYEVMITTSTLNQIALKAVKGNLLATIPDAYRDFDVSQGEDLLLSLPVTTNAKKVCHLDQNLYYYRIRQDSISHAYNPKRHRSIKAVHMEMEKYIDIWGLGTLHAKHYAREVRGWIDCLKRMLVCSDAIPEDILREMSEDDYFRKAYRNMDRDLLSERDMLLSTWLYERKYCCIAWAGKAHRLAAATKDKMKSSIGHMK
ncbi:MAG: glycosyltransferase family 2 protein [Christensenellales bacterium]